MCRAVENLQRKAAEKAAAEKEAQMVDIATNLVRDGILSLQEAAQRSSISEEIIRKEMGK